MMATAALFMPSLLFLICICLVAAGTGRTILLVRGALQARRQRVGGGDEGLSILLRSDLVPAVAVIAVPPDASEESRGFVRRLLNLHAGNAEVVLVLDGPAEAAMELWKREFHLERSSRAPASLLETKPVKALYLSTEPIHLVVIEKERGGRADCLNAAVNAAKAPVLATVDGNAQFAEDTLLRLLRPMLAEPDGTIAVCAVAPCVAAPGVSAGLYRLEFLRTWLCRCAGLSVSNTFLPTSGCFALISRDAVIQAQGFHAGPLEMLIRLHARARASLQPYRIAFLPDSTSRPVSPRSSGELRAAIAREQREVGAALRFHKGLLLGFGSLGWIALPGLLGSRLLLPLMETAGLVLGITATALGWIEPSTFGLLLAVPLVFEILISMTAVLLEPLALGATGEPNQLVALFFSAILENLGYRQLRNLWMMFGLLRGYRAAGSGAR